MIQAITMKSEANELVHTDTQSQRYTQGTQPGHILAQKQ